MAGVAAVEEEALAGADAVVVEADAEVVVAGVSN